MYPVLFHIGPLTLHTYGLLVACGILLGSQIAVFLAFRDGLEKRKAEEILYPLLTYLVIGGLIGGRVFYVLAQWQDFSGDLLSVVKIWQGGLVSYGGLIGAALGFFIWHRKNLSPPWKKVLDWIAPSLAFGHAVGRLGCFFAGCCYGLPTNRIWGVVFSDPECLAPHRIPLHPTQIYEFLFLAVLGTFLLRRFFAVRRSPLLSEGLIFSEYLILYSSGRFLIEFFRADPRTFLYMTQGQNMSLLILLAGLAFRAWIVSQRKKII
jgi:phosphatidylglycerol:prolipoprotein diacylglycerol transferase